MAFDRQVLQFMDRDEPVTDDTSVDSRTADNTDDGGMGFGADAPHMEIGNTHVARSLNEILYFLGNVIVGRIKED